MPRSPFCPIRLAPALRLVAAVTALAGCHKPANPNKGLSRARRAPGRLDGGHGEPRAQQPTRRMAQRGTRRRQHPLQPARPRSTPATSRQLKIAWTFSDGAQYGHEGAPLVAGNTMYVVTPYPNIAYALDLTKPGAPIKWSFAPNPSPMAIGKACCDAVHPRLGASRRQADLQPARRPHGRRRRQDRQGGLAHQDGQRRERGDHDHGRHRLRRQGLRRQLAAARWASTAGWRPSTSRPARSSGAPTTPAPTTR